MNLIQDDLEAFLEAGGPCASVYDCSRGFDDPTKTTPDARRRLTDPILADKNLGI